MYSILRFNFKNNHNSLKVLLSKSEMNSIKNNFSWFVNSDDVYPTFNFIEGHFLDILKTCCPTLEELITSNCQIEFDQFGVDHCTTIKKLIEYNFPHIESKCASNIGEPIVPLNGRPRFIVKESFFMDWHYELGLVQKYDFDNISIGFYHPKTHKFLFTEIDDFPSFKLDNKSNKDKLMKKYNTIVEDNNMFIRLLNVYDKQNGHLKYRITNEQFDMNSIGQLMLEPFADDDSLFMRSYEVTECMVAELMNYYDGLIDFDFKINKYFFETMDAKNFVTSYDDFLKNLRLAGNFYE